MKSMTTSLDHDSALHGWLGDFLISFSKVLDLTQLIYIIDILHF